jgi:hypothetical protein
MTAHGNRRWILDSFERAHERSEPSGWFSRLGPFECPEWLDPMEVDVRRRW